MIYEPYIILLSQLHEEMVSLVCISTFRKRFTISKTIVNTMDRDKTPRIVGPDLRSILYMYVCDIQHYFLRETIHFAWDELNCEDIEILSILQIVQELLEGTIFRNSRTRCPIYRLAYRHNLLETRKQTSSSSNKTIKRINDITLHFIFL